MKTSEISCDHRGIFLDDGFIPWNNIKEFKTSRDTLFYKSVHVIEKKEEEDGRVNRSIKTRLFRKSTESEHGAVHKITPDQFNGSAESFVVYLEEEKKRYGKKQELCITSR